MGFFKSSVPLPTSPWCIPYFFDTCNHFMGDQALFLLFDVVSKQRAGMSSSRPLVRKEALFTRFLGQEIAKIVHILQKIIYRIGSYSYLDRCGNTLITHPPSLTRIP